MRAGIPRTVGRRAGAGLSVLDGTAVLIGVVVGIGVFGFPPLVAAHAPTEQLYIGLWLAGGAVMLVGALCYAELGSAYPGAGGEYHYLCRAWGARTGMLFAWARGTVIQTGGIAAVAFIYGEYAQDLLPLWPGTPYGPAVHAASAVAALTALNVLSTRRSKHLQIVLTTLTLTALAVVAMAAFAAEPGSGAPAGLPGAAPARPDGNIAGMLGMGMVFVLLTFGGWNEAAYLSGELRNPQRDLVRVMVLGTLVVTACYLLINLGFLNLFGLEGLRDTHAVGAAVLRQVAGPDAAVVLSLLICATAGSTINACILTGGRIYYALGQDVPALRALGAWNPQSASPARALLLQGAITLALIAFGAWRQEGVEAMVAYTAPVFWFFMMLTAAALWRLRVIEPQTPRPFKVPLYPLTPLLLVLVCAALTWSSILYAGAGAWVGVAVLALCLPLLRHGRRNPAPPRP
ncbi:APC family permease [Orrella sp. JC864]|uniref:APC family permease n=1 Tax=Orrella sp. JC864 TaxID=3120298 RepID=UPI00300AA3FE